jgi:hypothetical protein
MATVAEASGAKSQLGASLAAAVDSISEFQKITFTLYRKVTLPLDGFVFWVRGTFVDTSLVPNTTTLNTDTATIIAAPTVTAKGSLHYSTDLSQNQDQTFATNRVVFTSEVEVADLNVIDPDIMYLAEHNGIRFAFSSRGFFYEQANLWHYHGDAVYPDLETQIVDDPSTFNVNNIIVSNSTPIWLSFNRTPMEDWDLIGPPNVPIYASYLLPANAQPPFISVHVDPASTKSVLAGSRMGPDSSTSQLCTESVQFTLIGLNNNSAQDFLDYIGQYTLNNPDVVGLMNSPAIRDDKRTQVELQTLAQKKFIDIDVNYYQSRVRSITRTTFQQVLVQYFTAATL